MISLIMAKCYAIILEKKISMQVKNHDKRENKA